MVQGYAVASLPGSFHRYAGVNRYVSERQMNNASIPPQYESITNHISTVSHETSSDNDMLQVTIRKLVT